MAALSPEVARLLAAKEQRRCKLAELPFPEKVRVVVRLQRMVAPILRARGRRIRVWNIEGVAAHRSGLQGFRRAVAEEGGAGTFLRREALAHAADTWYVPDSVKTGYEISFTRCARWRRSAPTSWWWRRKPRDCEARSLGAEAGDPRAEHLGSAFHHPCIYGNISP